MRVRVKSDDGIELSTFCRQLKLLAPDGKIMLGERSTTKIHRNENSQGFSKLKSDAKAGGDIAGTARKQLEKRLGRSVVSKAKFLPEKKKIT